MKYWINWWHVYNILFDREGRGGVRLISVTSLGPIFDLIERPKPARVLRWHVLPFPTDSCYWRRKTDNEKMLSHRAHLLHWRLGHLECLRHQTLKHRVEILKEYAQIVIHILNKLVQRTKDKIRCLIPKPMFEALHEGTDGIQLSDSILLWDHSVWSGHVLEDAA